MKYIVKDANENVVYSLENIKPNKVTDYIFLREYFTVYNRFKISDIMKKGIKITETNKRLFSHVAISFDLKDSFYGLTYDPKNINSGLKKESIVSPKKGEFMSACDPDKSTYAVYALPVSHLEYETAKNLVESAYKSQAIIYGTSKLFAFIFPNIARKFQNKRIDGSKEKHDAKQYGVENYSSEKEIEKYKFCCSTFVSAVLVKCIPKIKKWFTYHEINKDLVTPSDLTVLPNLYKLFEGKFKDYNTDKNNFLNKFREFKKYV